MNKQRIHKLQAELQFPMLVVKKENLFYFTGQHFIDGFLLVNKKQLVFFGNGLESPQGIKSDFIFNLGKYVKSGSVLLVEDSLPVSEWNYIKSKLTGVKLKSVGGLVENIRQYKSKQELAAMQLAYDITAKVFETVKFQLKKKQWTEEGLARYIRVWGLELGADEVSFDPIVASGINAAIPHHRPSANIIKPKKSIVLDFGFKVDGYCSDFTRTVFLGSIPTPLRKIYTAVEQAYNLAVASVRNGIQGSEVDLVARNYLKKVGFGNSFIHSLGHGTGLEVHEQPSLSPQANSVLQNGMVFSIEPGVYIPKLGGVRIEDLVYLEKGLPQYFVKVPTELNKNIL